MAGRRTQVGKHIVIAGGIFMQQLLIVQIFQYFTLQQPKITTLLMNKIHTIQAYY